MAIFSGKRRVLLVGGDGVVPYAFGSRGAEREGAVAWATPDFEQSLVDLLTLKNASSSVTILFDGADQTYRKVEDIPKLSFIDRPRFIRRKLDLSFPSYPIRAAMALHPIKQKHGITITNNKNDAPPYLFVALPETEQLDRVARVIYESGVSVTGFGLLPLESSAMLQEISRKLYQGKGRPSRWSILIGQHETGGLRQVVIKDGHLALTRLMQTSEGGEGGANWADDVLREFKATLTYISRFGYTPDDGVDVTIVCRDIEKQFLNVPAFGARNFSALNQGEALSLLNTRSTNLEKNNYADVLHAAWIVKKRKLLLPVRIPSIQKSVAPRMAATAAIGLLMLSALVLSGLSVNSGLDYKAKSDELTQRQNEITMLDREYDQESKKFEGLPVKPDVMKAVMTAKDAMEKSEMSVSAVLHAIRSSVGQDITLEKLSIRFEPGQDFSFEGVKSSAAGKPGILVLKPVKDKGDMVVSFSFSLPDIMPLEQKVQRAEKVKADLEKIFTKHLVSIRSQFGRFERTGRLTAELGAQGQVNPAVPANAQKDMAEIEIKGEPL